MDDSNADSHETFSIRYLLGECGCHAVTEEEETCASDLLADQLLELPRLLPPRRGVHESQEHREHFFLSYDMQREIVWAFAGRIAEVYEAVGRIGLKHCTDFTAFVRFSKSVARGLAEIATAAWMRATEDFTLYPLMEHDGIARTYGGPEVQDVIRSSFEPKRRMLEIAAKATVDSSARAEPRPGESGPLLGSDARSAHEMLDRGILVDDTRSAETAAHAPSRKKEPPSPEEMRIRIERRAFVFEAIKRKYRSIPKFAAKTCIEPRSLYDWKKGKTGHLSDANVQILAEALQIPEDKLQGL